MTSTEFDRRLQEWLVSQAPAGWRAPDGMLTSVNARVDRTAQRPAWLARASAGVLGAGAAARAMPAMQGALLLLKIVLIAALALAAAGAAAWLLRSMDEPGPRNGPILYSFTNNIPGGGTSHDTHLVEADGSNDRFFVRDHSCPTLSAAGDRLYSLGPVRYTPEGHSLTDLRVLEFNGAGEILTSFSGLDTIPVALSPDGLSVAFATWAFGSANAPELLVAALDGSSQLILAPPDASVPTHLSWSPGGDWIAFRTESGAYIGRPDGSEIRMIGMVKPETAWAFSWSPDGDRMAYGRPTGADGAQHIFTAAADGSGERRLTSSPVQAHDLRWSPDGSLIAFQSAERRVGLIDAASGDVRYLVGLETVTTFAWSPDSRYIVASANAGLWKAAVAEDGGPPVALRRTPRPRCVLWLPELPQAP
jgi:hypothetical protein